MNTTAQVKQVLKKSAQQMGQQMAQEPLELLKAARSQLTGEDLDYGNNGGYENPEEAAEKKRNQEEAVLKQKVAYADQRHLEALQSEMMDIRRQKLFNELLQRIQAGENVTIEEFQELTHEQRAVLKAHLESVKAKRQEQTANGQLIEPTPKKNRRLAGFGQKQAAQKQTTRVEKPVPPSG